MGRSGKLPVIETYRRTYNRLDKKAQDYEKAADDALLWGLRRILLPGESIKKLIKLDGIEPTTS
jgi:hypothetical protein